MCPSVSQLSNISHGFTLGQSLSKIWGQHCASLYFYGVYNAGETDKTHVSQSKVILDGYTSSKENIMCEGNRSVWGVGT